MHNRFSLCTIGALERLMVEPDERSVRELAPVHRALAKLSARAVIVTAAAERPGNRYDFVSRFFAPKLGIPEDPVTGSAYTTLAPFRSRRLNRTAVVSARTGLVGAEVAGDQILLTGRAVATVIGELRG